MEKFAQEKLVIDKSDVIEIETEWETSTVIPGRSPVRSVGDTWIKVKGFRVEQELSPEYRRLVDEYGDIEAEQIYKVINGGTR